MYVGLTDEVYTYEGEETDGVGVDDVEVGVEDEGGRLRECDLLRRLAGGISSVLAPSCCPGTWKRST